MSARQGADLPLEQVLTFDPEPIGDADLEFRLLYHGTLLGSSRNNSRAQHKAEIRRHFHGQLRELWKTKPPLIDHLRRHADERWDESELEKLAAQRLRKIADNYEMFGYRFVPLITDEMALRCSLDILFLRREEPGRLLVTGDIDGRVKTVFDALRMPKSAKETDGKHDDDDPFYCLLEDDKFVSSVRVVTDQLLGLLPNRTEENQNDAFLVINVKVITIRALVGNAGWGV